MALETAIRNLNTQILKLHNELRPLLLTVIEDVPEPNASVLVEKFGDHLMDLKGMTEGMMSEAADAQQAARYPVNYERMRHALTGIHEKHNRLLRMYCQELISYQQLSLLIKLGRERGREWLPWANTTWEGLEHCRTPVFEVNQALFQCWAEMAERIGMNSVNVQAIGQISMPETKHEKQEEI